MIEYSKIELDQIGQRRYPVKRCDGPEAAADVLVDNERPDAPVLLRLPAPPHSQR